MSGGPAIAKRGKMDPHLLAAIEEHLNTYQGVARERAIGAIMQLRKDRIQGTFEQLVTRYRAAIDAAAKAS